MWYPRSNLGGYLFPGGFRLQPAAGVYVSTLDIVKHERKPSLKWNVTDVNHRTASFIPCVPDPLLNVGVFVAVALVGYGVCRHARNRFTWKGSASTPEME